MTIITSKTSSNKPKTANLFRLFRAYFQPHLGWFLVGTFFAALTALCATGYAIVVGLVFRGMEAALADANAPTDWVWWTTIAIVGLTIGRAVSLYAMTMFNNTGVQRGLVDVQSAQFDDLVDGDFARVAADASGGFVSRFINDVNSIRDASLRFANNFTKGIVTIVGALGVMLWYDWKLTLILLVLYPVAFGPVIALGNRIRTRSKDAQKQVGEVTALLSEGLQSMRVVKAYGLQTYQKDKSRKGFIERSRLFLKVLADRAAVDPILEVTGGLALAGVLGISAWRITNGDSSLESLMTVITAIGVASPELRALGTLNAVAQEGAAAADRVYEILDAPVIVTEPDAPKIFPTEISHIVFEDVEFAYPDGTKALKGFDLQIQAGETVAFVGQSGAGKSTLFNLLLRLYDPTNGSVQIGGVSLAKFRASDVRANTALVSQDTALFDDTVEANIRLGKLDSNQDEIIRAAQAANAHEFVSEFERGYQTQVGEMGRNLSGGQRQRIALSRAILRGAPILLLDEATSALDAESEAKVQAALASFSEGRTTLIIAHRLSTVKSADRIVVVDDGRVIEQGSHEQLMQDGAAYKALVEMQLS